MKTFRQEAVACLDNAAGVKRIWVDRVDSSTVVKPVACEGDIRYKRRSFEPWLQVSNFQIVASIHQAVVGDDGVRAFPSGRACGVRETVVDETSASRAKLVDADKRGVWDGT